MVSHRFFKGHWYLHDPWGMTSALLGAGKKKMSRRPGDVTRAVSRLMGAKHVDGNPSSFGGLKHARTIYCSTYTYMEVS